MVERRQNKRASLTSLQGIDSNPCLAFGPAKIGKSSREQSYNLKSFLPAYIETKPTMHLAQAAPRHATTL